MRCRGSPEGPPCQEVEAFCKGSRGRVALLRGLLRAVPARPGAGLPSWLHQLRSRPRIYPHSMVPQVHSPGRMGKGPVSIGETTIPIVLLQHGESH